MPALSHDLREALIERVSEAHVAYHSALKKREGPDALRAVDDLVGHDEVARGDLLLQ
jgi:hypothetical protein